MGDASVFEEVTASQAWVLLLYTLPREPSAPRVAVWRKLKKLSALLLHDAVWVLPARPALIEHFRWLASEIGESGGQAFIWIAEQGLPGQDEALVVQFQTQAEEEYQTILAALDVPHVEQAMVARRYQAAAACDYFHAPSAESVRSRLEARGAGKTNAHKRDANREEG
jgi:hypothetical protein